MPPAALELRGLSKRFGTTVAVNDLSIVVPRGSFYGVVGPNGAGKTTTLAMATGLLRPDSGTARVLGVDVWREPQRAAELLGVLPDGVRLFDRLTGAELITYAGLLRAMPRDVVAQRTADLLDVLGLASAGRTLVADYSAGMTKKVALACAIVHAPAVLVLDEPFEAVDPVSTSGIRKILQAFVASGGTVVLSSHVMDLVQRMCDHVAIVDAGRVLTAGPIDQVRAGGDLDDRFIELVGQSDQVEALQWLKPSFD